MFQPLRNSTNEKQEDHLFATSTHYAGQMETTCFLFKINRLSYVFYFFIDIQIIDEVTKVLE